MKIFSSALMMVLLLALVSGCGSDKDKGMNRHKDLPRATTTDKAEPRP